MSAPLEEPSIPARLQRPLAAIWVSLGLHLGLLALVQVAPPGTGGAGGPVIEARLVSAHRTAAAAPAPVAVEPLPAPAAVAPSELADTVPVVPTPTPTPTPIDPAAAGRPAEAAPVEPPAAPSPASPVTLTSAVDLTYYSAREVDVHPRALAEILPAYPEVADREKLSGKVVLQLKLEADGRVIDAEVVRSSPPDVFDAAALEAFRQARFAPAIRAGQPVRALMLIEVVFDWAGRPLGTGSPLSPLR